MRKETLSKIRDEKALTPLEMFELEEQLDRQSQAGLSHLARKAGEEEPSMAWRSSLNERLASLAPAKPKAPRWVSWLRWGAPALAGAACALGFFAFMRGPASPTPTPKETQVASAERTAPKDVESTLVFLHRVGHSADEAGLVLPVESGSSYTWSDLEAY